MLEPDEGELSSPVLRGPAPSNGGWPLGRNAKGTICGTRFGAPVFFAFSGLNNAASALCAIPKSLASLGGDCITAYPA